MNSLKNMVKLLNYLNRIMTNCLVGLLGKGFVDLQVGQLRVEQVGLEDYNC